jgi:superfamily I DNA and/or RNA helicase
MNEKELNVVVDYVKRIVAELHVKESDIGVISPYTYQVRYIFNRRIEYQKM